MTEPRRDDVEQPDAWREGAPTEQLLEVTETERDASNPEWWKNEDRQRGEVH
jgi:hypothetical protein